MRTFVLYRRSFAYGNAPCIAHETLDGEKTLCGRLVKRAEAIEPDERDSAEPDCLACRRALEALRPKNAKETP